MISRAFIRDEAERALISTLVIVAGNLRLLSELTSMSQCALAIWKVQALRQPFANKTNLSTVLDIEENSMRKRSSVQSISSWLIRI